MVEQRSWLNETMEKKSCIHVAKVCIARVERWRIDFDCWKHVGYVESAMTENKPMIPVRNRVDPRRVPIKKGKIVGICNHHFMDGSFDVLAVGRVTKGTRRTTTLEVLHAFDEKYEVVGAVITVKNLYMIIPRFGTMLEISNFIDEH